MEFGLINLCVCATVALLLLQFDGCVACLEQERAALLQFKHSLIIDTTNSIPAEALASWVEEDGGDNRESDCCDWERVHCNPTTRRISRLSLNFTRVRDQSTIVDDGIYSRPSSTNGFLINLTVFLPLEELEHFDLSYNCITGWLENQGIPLCRP